MFRGGASTAFLLSYITHHNCICKSLIHLNGIDFFKRDKEEQPTANARGYVDPMAAAAVEPMSAVSRI